MSELRLAYPACMLVEKTEITAADVQLMGNRMFQNGLNRKNDVVTLLAIEHSNSKKSKEWDAYFVEVLSNHVRAMADVSGTLPLAATQWVRSMFCRGGIVASRNEFRVMVEVIEELRKGCPELATFALEQIHYAVTEGEGPLARSRKGIWATISMDQLVFINRILVALGNPEPFSISDAEALFDPAQNLYNDRQATAWGELVATLTRPEAIAA